MTPWTSVQARPSDPHPQSPAPGGSPDTPDVGTKLGVGFTLFLQREPHAPHFQPYDSQLAVTGGLWACPGPGCGCSTPWQPHSEVPTMKQQMQNSGLWLATGRLGNAEPCVPERPPQGTSGSLGTE